MASFGYTLIHKADKVISTVDILIQSYLSWLY